MGGAAGVTKLMGEAAAKAQGKTLGDLRTPPYDGQTGPRKDGAIAFAVTRGGDVIGDHEIKFISDEEIILIGHRALNRALFANSRRNGSRRSGRPATSRLPLRRGGRSLEAERAPGHPVARVEEVVERRLEVVGRDPDRLLYVIRYGGRRVRRTLAVGRQHRSPPEQLLEERRGHPLGPVEDGVEP